MYEKILKKRDNFILAAIQCEDDFMKRLWLNRAEKMSQLLKLYSNYRVNEVCE